jgi:hypothetical protein
MELAGEYVMVKIAGPDELLREIACCSRQIVYQFNVAGAAWHDPTPETV